MATAEKEILDGIKDGVATGFFPTLAGLAGGWFAGMRRSKKRDLANGKAIAGMEARIGVLEVQAAKDKQFKVTIITSLYNQMDVLDALVSLRDVAYGKFPPDEAETRRMTAERATKAISDSRKGLMDFLKELA